jgi:hypothetical protein
MSGRAAWGSAFRKGLRAALSSSQIVAVQGH